MSTVSSYTNLLEQTNFMAFAPTPVSDMTPDMDYGIESVSCELARAFYFYHRDKLVDVRDLADVYTLYSESWRFWCPLHLIYASRSTKQVMYAMTYYIRACQICESNVVWYSDPYIPSMPRNFPNQLNLISNVTMRDKRKESPVCEMIMDEI